MKTHFSRLALGGALAAAVGCAAPGGGAGGDDLGVVQLALTAPSGVGCVRTTFAGGRTVTKDVLVSGEISTRLDGLPTGSVTITSAAYPRACGVGEPLWLADPLTVALQAGRSTPVQIVFRKNGIALVTTSFVDDAPAGGFRDDFDGPLSQTDWVTSFTAGAANVFVADGNLTLETVPNNGCATAQAHGLRTFSVTDGTVHFSSRVLDAYVDQGIYGDAQPRGLVAGADRSNAIEFINAYPVPSHVTCRTVANGTATETTVDIGQSVRSPALYEVKATSTSVQFLVNGSVVATHATNIPQVPLNAYYSTGDSCAGNVPVVVDWVSIQME
jgi:hypothetical protein